jgi:integrase
MKKLHMTWVPGSRRWRKLYKGKWYAVSCRQLGCEETKDASWRLANEWWERERGTADSAPPTEDDRRANAFKVWSMVQDWDGFDEESRERLVDSILGAGQYRKIRGQAETLVAAVKAPAAGRSVAEHVGEWENFLRSTCRAGQMSEGRFDAYCRNIDVFTRWAGPESAIDAIDESKIEGYFTHLSVQVSAGKYSPSYAHTLLMTAKQFISRLAERKLIPLPGNIRSRRLRFNHSAPRTIETFTAEEVRAMLAAAVGDRMHLYLLLMLNCGMYQNDIAELRKDEVNWSKGTVTRGRSKTRERRGPVVTYKLWPETFVLLKQYRSDGDLVLVTDKGKPLVRYWIEGESMRRYDMVQAGWVRLTKKMKAGKIRLGMKHLRKTAASTLAGHPQFKFYANHFLADSPKTVADSHYVVRSEPEFFAALSWLRGEILGTGSNS